jgi:hypothetical protein
MNKLLGFLGMALGGWAGWAAGAPISIFTAFILSVVGTGVGLWAARRLAQLYF